MKIMPVTLGPVPVTLGPIPVTLGPIPVTLGPIPVTLGPIPVTSFLFPGVSPLWAGSRTRAPLQFVWAGPGTRASLWAWPIPPHISPWCDGPGTATENPQLPQPLVLMPRDEISREGTPSL